MKPGRALARRAQKEAMRRHRSLVWTEWETGKCDEVDKVNCKLDGAEFVHHNNEFFVVECHVPSDIGVMTVLVIAAKSANTYRESAHFQRIKNELVGENFTAVEVFHDERTGQKSTDVTYLWCLPDGVTLPFGPRLKPA